MPAGSPVNHCASPRGEKEPCTNSRYERHADRQCSGSGQLALWSSLGKCMLGSHTGGHNAALNSVDHVNVPRLTCVGRMHAIQLEIHQYRKDYGPVSIF